MYAVNLFDMMGDPLLTELLLRPVLGAEVQVNSKRVDGVGLVLNCDSERAEAIVQIVRTRYRPSQLRFYKQTGSRWEAL